MEDNNKYYQSRHFLRLLHRYEKAISEGQTPYMEADELTDIAEYYMTGKQDAKADCRLDRPAHQGACFGYAKVQGVVCALGH